MVYVAFLRAINVGGRAVVKMDAICDAFAAAGCKNVHTVIASGNVIFEAPATGQAALTKRICRRLEKVIGKDPGVFIRTKSELASVIQTDPFRRSARERNVKFYVVFLGGRPREMPNLPLRSNDEAVEAIAMTGREVFVVSRPKKGKFYGFPNGVIEKEFRVTTTTRNWNTVKKIASVF
jgi:uncharacterized protein (DUF1697 family)